MTKQKEIKMNIKEYFKGVRERLPALRKGMYATVRKMIYVAGVGVFITIILIVVVRVMSFRAEQQQQRRLASFPLLIDGASYCREKQYKKGIEEFQKAIEKNPGEDNADAYFGLAFAYRELGQYEKSIEC